MSQTIAYQIEDRCYLNITDRCTLSCQFCPKHNGSWDVHEYNLELDHRPKIQEIMSEIGDVTRFSEVVFCGFGESTLRLKVLLAVAAEVKSKGVKVRLNTDGLGNRVNKHNILPELAKVVDAVSVSMNAHNEQVYQQHCLPSLEGSFQDMLEFLKLAPEYIDDVTATAIDGLEGVDIDACESIAQNLGVQFKRRHLDVVG